jgi:uncharacterized protein YukE
MRAKAALLRSQADQVASAATRIASTVHRIEFEGPAATRFRRDLAWWQFGVSGLVAELHSAADALLRGASQVEEAQHQHALLQQQALDQAAQAQRAQRARK